MGAQVGVVGVHISPNQQVSGEARAQGAWCGGKQRWGRWGKMARFILSALASVETGRDVQPLCGEKVKRRPGLRYPAPGAGDRAAAAAAGGVRPWTPETWSRRKWLVQLCPT